MVSRMERSNLRPGVLRIFLAPGLWDDRVGGGGERRRPTCRPDHTRKEIAACVTAALSAPIRSATIRRAAILARYLTGIDFLENPGVPSPVSGHQEDQNPPSPRVGEGGWGGMRGKSVENAEHRSSLPGTLPLRAAWRPITDTAPSAPSRLPAAARR